MKSNDLIDEERAPFPTRDVWSNKEISSLVGVRPGDRFMRYQKLGWADGKHVIVECTRVTPKQAVIGGDKYWIEDAGMVGRYGGSLMPIDQAKIEADEKADKIRKFRRELSNTNWEKVPDHTVIAAIYLLRGK